MKKPRKILENIKANKNENPTYKIYGKKQQQLLRGKFIMIQERSQINNPIYHLKEFEKNKSQSQQNKGNKDQRGDRFKTNKQTTTKKKNKEINKTKTRFNKIKLVF